MFCFLPGRSDCFAGVAEFKVGSSKSKNGKDKGDASIEEVLVDAVLPAEDDELEEAEHDYGDGELPSYVFGTI